MANEIVALENNNGEQGVLFLFPVTNPKAGIVPTPSASLPLIAAAVLSAGEKANLDAGTWAFEVNSFLRQGIAGGALLAKVQQFYASRLAVFNADYTQRYALAGNRYDA